MKKIKYITLLLLGASLCKAQFPGPVGSINTTAIHKDSSAFVGWASKCTVIRGLQDISNFSLGLTDSGEDNFGTGKAGDNPVVSLGDGGSAICEFSEPIMNGPGADFAVFENAFNDAFLELAFVEVSSDGTNYFRFPAISHITNTTQIGPFDELGDATKLHNLAGKYRFFYGTPFDLEELNSMPGLNINAITHVKIIDVVGCIQTPHARFDSQSNVINDPYPTAFNNGGFDLDAIGVIHKASVGIRENSLQTNFHVYPNPASEWIKISCNIPVDSYKIKDSNGTDIMSNSGDKKNQVIIHLEELREGLYCIELTCDKIVYTKKLIVTH